MGRTLNAPRVSELAAIEARRMARLAGDPAHAAELAQPTLKAAKRLERAKRFADQIQHELDSSAKRAAQSAAKAARDERRAAKAAHEAQVEARRRARIERRAGVESRRQARLERKLAKDAKWATAAEKEDAAYKWRLRKAEIADYKAHRRTYLDEQKRLKRDVPWTLVLQQDEIVELAYRRKLQLRMDERGAKAVAGLDDPETILDWRRATKAFRSASASWQNEKRKLTKLTFEAKAFDLRQS